jgi:hypothetical protein
MQHNEWATLPLPVLDCIFRHKLWYDDLRHMALTCKSWNAAVCSKVPYAVRIMTEGDKQRAEAMRWTAEQRKEEREVEQWRQRVRRNQQRRPVILFLETQLLAAACLAIGTTGLVFFPPLFRSVSIVPDCDAAYSMRASLYACCALWIVNAALLFFLSLPFFFSTRVASLSTRSGVR